MNLKLEKNKWYAWQMLPGYNEERYLSPIKVLGIDRSKGTDSVILNFYNACYANCVKEVCYDLKIIAHSKDCLICEVESKEKNNSCRMAIIEEIDYLWLRRYITKKNIDQNIHITDYLDKYY